MKQHQFSFVQALIVAVGVLFFSGCNGEKIDSDLIDSITGKVSVDKITIDQEDFEMTEGESTVLTATVLPADATDKTVSWHSSKEDVVMISNTGKAMAIAPGKSIITAKAGNKTDFITITVIANAVHVTGISLDKTTLELKVDDSETLTATVTPPDATNKNVSWTSSDAAVVTVENGKVTGVKPGSVTITAKTEDGGMIAECTVTVKTNLAPSVTVGAVNISAVSVVLKGEANLDAQMSSDMTMGIMWSENSGVLPSNSTKIEAKNIEAKEGSTTSYFYSVNLTGLDPEKTYYFRSYVTQNSQDTYGETMSFTTKELSSMIHTEDASNISAVSAILNAPYDLTDVQYTNKTIGIYYGTSAETLSETYIAETSSSEGSISENWTLLEPEQTYYCQSYIILDGKEYKESVKSFTTKALSSMIHTEEASNVSAVSAVMNVTYDLTDVQYTNKSIGIYYGTSAKSLSKTYVAEITSTRGEISENWLVLKPATEYFYQVYVKLDNKLYKEEIRAFTTKGLSSMLETKGASDIAPTSAKIIAKLDLTDVQYTTMDYGFYWGSSKDSQTMYAKGGEIAENAYFVPLTGLSHKTQYWYRAYLKVDNQEFYGEDKTFTTDVVPVTSVSLDKDACFVHTIDSTFTLTPTILPEDATSKSVSWESSNPSVATVDVNGKVTAKGNGAATITVTTEDQSKTATCEVKVAQWVAGIVLDQTTLVLIEGQTATISVASITPDNANDKSVIWSSDNTSVVSVDQSGKVTAKSKGTATIKATANDGSGISGSCSVAVIQTSGAVDLGLSVKWAACNLCESGFVSSPEDYGDYYAWGETQPYYTEGHSQDNPCSGWRSRTNPVITGYNWSSYKWCNGSSSTLTKYNASRLYGSTVDKKNVLEADDDVAHVKLGGSWRMPTYDEWAELMRNCNWTWTTLNGINGRLMTSTKNGASIFLPAAGFRDNTRLYSVGSRGYYWSSSLRMADSYHAYYVDAYSGYVSIDHYSRCNGYSVRPVSE